MYVRFERRRCTSRKMCVGVAVGLQGLLGFSGAGARGCARVPERQTITVCITLSVTVRCVCGARLSGLCAS